MQTRLVQLDPLRPDPAVLDEAAALLQAGQLVAFPTETVYGLGANALDAQAVLRIFAAKGRPATNPVIVHVSSIEQAAALVINWPAEAERLAQAFWPGSLTFVLAKRDAVPPEVTAGGPTVALRMPAHPVAQELLARVGVPLAAPSANRSTRISPTTAAHVMKELGGRIPLVLDAGPTTGGLESTVLDLSGEVPRILRPGLVTAQQLEQALSRPLSTVERAVPTEIARSPGQMERHYAPSAPVDLAGGEAAQRVVELTAQGRRAGWLAMGDYDNTVAALVIAMPDSPPAYAARLYAALHELEDAGVEHIIVTLPPPTPEWQAIHDRLRRAASG